MTEEVHLLLCGIGKAAEQKVDLIRNSDFVICRGEAAFDWLKEQNIEPHLRYSVEKEHPISVWLEKASLALANKKKVTYVTPFSPILTDQLATGLISSIGQPQLEIVEGSNLLDGMHILMTNSQPLITVDGLSLKDRYHPPFSADHNVIIIEPGSSDEIGKLKQILLRVFSGGHPVYAYMEKDNQYDWKQSSVSSLGNEQERLSALFIEAASSDRSLESFEEIIAHLRAPEDGCPWDKKQTHTSLRTYLLEETYEALDALDQNNLESLKEELGDILLQILLHSQIAVENGEFTMADVLQRINQKIVYRHPHVFKNWIVSGEDDVVQNWESLKGQEREKNGDEKKKGMLDGVPLSSPALAQAQSIQQRAARVGFDWPDITPVMDKVVEELEEVRSAANDEERAKELGDLLFAIVNVIRWYKVDAESALRQTNLKFRNRFAFIEENARRNGKDVQAMTLDEMDALWEEAKNGEA